MAASNVAIVPIDESNRMRSFVALAEIERLDGLKLVVGHAEAVHVLERLAGTIRSLLPRCERIRVGRKRLEIELLGDSRAAVVASLERVVAHVSERVMIQGFEFELKLVVGAADSEGCAISDELIDQAEEALSCARQTGTVQIVGSSQKPGASLDRLTLMRGLQRAIREGQLHLHYQPKVRARTGKTTSVEALLRWPVEFGGLSPDIFIPLAEDTGDIRLLTEWVIGRAIEDQARLKAAGFDMPVDLNLSGALLADPDCGRQMIACCAGAEGKIGFEVTETAMIAHPERALSTLQTLASAGIRLAIDDYGSGFSSLAYLQKLPFNEIKIDRMFISRLSSGQRDPLLVRSTIDLAHALEMEVTAEGVDSPAISALLQVMGCDLLQGYHLSPALPVSELQNFLTAERGRGEVGQIESLSHRLKRRK